MAANRTGSAISTIRPDSDTVLDRATDTNGDKVSGSAAATNGGKSSARRASHNGAGARAAYTLTLPVDTATRNRPEKAGGCQMMRNESKVSGRHCL